MKCPACGIMCKHKVRWSAEQKLLLHICAQCDALWGQDPVAPYDKWNLTVTLPEQQTRKPQ